MPKPVKGEVRWSEQGPVARITLKGKHRESYLLASCKTEEEAQERAQVLATLAQRFRKANVIETRDALQLLTTAAGCAPSLLVGVLQVAGELCGGRLEDESKPVVPTFKELGDEWTSGALHKKHPHHVRLVIQTTNTLRLDKSIYPVIGHKPVDKVTRADCEAVMSGLESDLSQATRRQYAVLLNRILNLAEFLGHIERNPLPKGWLPSPGPGKRFPILYPREDAALLACTKVPLADRLLWGFLHREGMRRGEAEQLQFREIDFDHETIALDENKTDNPRWWKLGPGVARALKRWKESRDAKPDDFVFIDENGGPLNLDHMADRVRAHLKAAELERVDLYSTSPLKGRFGTHCFRRSFVTRSLALGKNEDWVRQRTGHTSDELLTYRQAAKSVAELELGDLNPLDVALSDLFEERRLPPDCPKNGRGGRIRTCDPQTPSLVR